jgi:nucleoside permease NupC
MFPICFLFSFNYRRFTPRKITIRLFVKAFVMCFMLYPDYRWHVDMHNVRLHHLFGHITPECY